MMFVSSTSSSDPAFDNKKQSMLRLARLQAIIAFDTPLDSSIVDTLRRDLKTI